MKKPVKVAIIGTNIAAPMLSRESLTGRQGVDWRSRLEQLVPVLRRIGYAGLRIFPTHALTADIVRDPDLANEWVQSLHQNFHSGKGPRGRFLSWLQPTEAGSVADIRAIQSRLRRPVPGVFYLGHSLTEGETGTVVRGVQPKAAEYQTVRASDAGEFYRAIQCLEHGANAIILDAAHGRSRSQRKDGKMLPNWHEDWGTYLGLGAVSHADLGFFRTDMARWDPDIARTTVQEGAAFSSGDWQKARRTEVGDMVGLLLDKWTPHPLAGDDTLRLVVETPPSPIGTVQDFVKREQPIVEALGQIVEHSGGVLMRPPQA